MAQSEDHGTGRVLPDPARPLPHSRGPLGKRKRNDNAYKTEEASLDTAGGFKYVGPFFYGPDQISRKQEERLRAVVSDGYYKEKVASLIVPVVKQEYDISLRALDWFVVNYCKQRRLLCGNTGELRAADAFDIFLEYKTTLKLWKRRCFDPFRRRERIFFEWGDDVLTTTVGQLSFLLWAERNGVIEQARQNIEDIEDDMVKVLARSKKRKQGTTSESRRTELTKAPVCACIVYAVETSVEFDMDSPNS